MPNSAETWWHLSFFQHMVLTFQWILKKKKKAISSSRLCSHVKKIHCRHLSSALLFFLPVFLLISFSLEGLNCFLDTFLQAVIQNDSEQIFLFFSEGGLSVLTQSPDYGILFFFYLCVWLDESWITPMLYEVIHVNIKMGMLILH